MLLIGVYYSKVYGDFDGTNVEIDLSVLRHYIETQNVDVIGTGTREELIKVAKEFKENTKYKKIFLIEGEEI